MQARTFGSSTFIQASDYQAAADVSGFATNYVLQGNHLNMTLLPAAVALLSNTGPNQFRITLTENDFSNYNGAAKVAGGGVWTARNGPVTHCTAPT